MVKTYFKYQFDKNVGHVSGTQCGMAYHAGSRRIFSGSNQYVTVVGSRTGDIQGYLSRPHKNRLVRCIRVFGDQIYAGYEDGQIIVWNCITLEYVTSLDQHKSAVVDMATTDDNSRLISAGQDCRIIIWDLLSEESATIKEAHRAPITQIAIMSVSNSLNGLQQELLISTGKDGFIKVWNIKTLQLLDVLSSLTNEIPCFLPYQDLIIVATTRQDLLIVRMEPHKEENVTRFCQLVGRFKRNNFARPLQLVAEAAKMYLLNSDKTIEMYDLLDQREFIKRKKRLMKRKHKQSEENQEKMEVQEENARIKLQKQRVLLHKSYNILLINGRIFVNSGRDIQDVTSDSQLTKSLGATHTLHLQHPYLVQRHYSTCSVLSVTNMNNLYTIDLTEEDEPVTLTSCQIYKGYLILLAEQCLLVWSLAKGEELLRSPMVNGKGMHVSNQGLFVWRDNILYFCQLGLDKQHNLAVNKLSQRLLPQKITQCSSLGQDKYIVCTQDAQINIFYSDSHKQHMKLYGHKLPILSYDVATDQTIILTGSVDKDIKLWGLDFGNCIKSIFAHSQAVTIVRFVPDTHYFFTGSKDGHIKYWDGDTYQLILDLEESIGEVRDMCISKAGDYMIAGGVDGGFRVWKQTTQQIFYAQQQEKRMEKMMIEDYANKKLEENEEKTTYAELKHGQEIIECLEQSDKPTTLLRLLKRIAPSKLKPSLSFLHRHHVDKLNIYLRFWIDNRIETELVWRICKALNIEEVEMSQELRKIWTEDRDKIRVNIEALRLIGKVIEDNKEIGAI